MSREDLQWWAEGNGEERVPEGCCPECTNPYRDCTCECSHCGSRFNDPEAGCDACRSGESGTESDGAGDLL